VVLTQIWESFCHKIWASVLWAAALVLVLTSLVLMLVVEPAGQLEVEPLD
jgi:hypothetical protein